jgi:hypothetical protein
VPLSSQSQDDFGGGIYSGRKAPADTVYDLVNGMINDEGLVYRRGGSAYYSTSNALASITGMIASYLPAPAANRVMITTAAARYVLDGTLAPVASPFTNAIGSRPTTIGNYMIFVGNAATNQVVFYAGSLKSAQYTTGTVTVTAGSATVTGSGTSWSANVDAGMILTSGLQSAVVKKVTSNTALTLTDSWAGSTAAGAAYSLDAESSGLLFGFGAGRSYVAAGGSGSPRLMYGIGNRVYFSERGENGTLSETDYHQMPGNAFVIGMEGRGDSVWVFTTAGVWVIGNLSFDPIDAYGNIQHTVEQVSKDVILWDDFGIAGFSGGVVIPCVDDVFVATPDFSLTAITGRIRPLYRSYVKAGYQLGMAIRAPRPLHPADPEQRQPRRRARVPPRPRRGMVPMGRARRWHCLRTLDGRDGPRPETPRRQRPPRHRPHRLLRHGHERRPTRTAPPRTSSSRPATTRPARTSPASRTRSGPATSSPPPTSPPSPSRTAATRTPDRSRPSRHAAARTARAAGRTRTAASTSGRT